MAGTSKEGVTETPEAVLRMAVEKGWLTKDEAKIEENEQKRLRSEIRSTVKREALSRNPNLIQ